MSLHVEHLTIEVQGRPLFRDVSWQVRAGTCIAIMGPSGSGKTSLINAIAGLLPSTGTIMLDGVEVSGLSQRRREDHRLRSIGMVFQDGDLLPELTAVENAGFPARLLGQHPDDYHARAVADLEHVGLGDRLDSWPSDLSGGEIQRVAIARALSNEPVLLLADEPTGALDRTNANHVAEVLSFLAHERNACVLIATHDPDIAKHCDEVFQCEDLTLVRR